MLLPLFLAALGTLSHADPSPKLSSLLWSRDTGFSVVPGLSTTSDTLAVANYTNAVNSTGWTYLELETYRTFPDEIQAYGAGYLEGHITMELLNMHYDNTIVGRCDGKEDLCDKIEDWVDENYHWVNKKMRHNGKRDPYWHQVYLFYSQMAGMAMGYNVAAKEAGRTHIRYRDIVDMNIFGDLEDLEQALGDDVVPAKVRGQGRCSALVRLLPGASDLLVSHDTWNTYQSMLRILKKYTLPFHTRAGGKKLVPGHTMTFSGYPGVIYSGDDFTLASSGLAILETTIGNSNPKLWRHVKRAGSVLEGIRATVANRLATTGKEWVKLFSRHNSGTYNNQWMVVDYNRFTPGQDQLQPGLFWVLEQIPGYIRTDDLTQVLQGQQFWPSYNSPFFPDVFEKSGCAELVKKYGDWFSYKNTPRARIFRRDAPNVVDIPGMVRLMRYNNYTMDPFSACNCTPPYSAENAISARCDLNPKNGSYPFGALGHRSHGATDMKLTSSGMFKDLEFLAQAGPTWDPLPPFRWSDQDFAADTPHVGHPDLWQFAPVQHKWAKTGTTEQL